MSLTVVMIVSNSCINDSRVIKEAEALAKAGYVVTIVCRKTAGTVQEQIIEDVKYIRVNMENDHLYKYVASYLNYFFKTKLENQ